MLQRRKQPQELKLVLVISEPFLERFNGKTPLPYDDPRLSGRNEDLRTRIANAIARQDYSADENGWDFSYHCVYLTLRSSWGFELTRVARIAPPDFISEIWHNATYRPALDKSLTTIKVDQLRQHHPLKGNGVIWAVVDTGIKATHPGFGGRVVAPQHDLTGKNNPDDANGHGTHVAGIIGGYLDAQSLQSYPPNQQVDEAGNAVSPLSGVAPEIQLVNLKVIEQADDNNNTNALEKALGLILSGSVQVDGVNLSLENDPKEEHWCSGDCPVCTRIKQITDKKIIVCAAAGNWERLRTIACPGRAEEAITVGACHKSDPPVYGIHYKSAGGPTPDGRAKPDVVAPGGDILSYCIKFSSKGPLYAQKTGTSMATPFVSGLCALLLEERRAAKKTSNCKLMKEILSTSAENLNRAYNLQGSGVINAVDALARSQTK
jgi:subtilisin family serine protease